MRNLYSICLYALLLNLFVLGAASCQEGLPEPPSNLEGAALREWFKDNWYSGSHKQLGYDNARRAMYSYVDEAEDGRVYCVYTGFSEPARETTFLDPINAEHTVPQSFFDRDEPMRSDLHHLFPTHELVNSSRGNIDFGEVEDAIADKWFIGGRVEDGTGLTILTTVPTENIDEYSEIDNNDLFEVKEANKGNTARAIFYFYTMYPTQAGSISALADLDILYQWHLNDPVDEAERIRNDRVEERQGNRNPYIDYPELVASAWELAEVCLEPNVEAREVRVDNISGTQASIAWRNGSGSERVVLLKEGDAAFGTAELPADGETYMAGAVFGEGDALGNAYVIYSGNESSITVSGLNAETSYSGVVVEFDCDPATYGMASQSFSFSTTATGLPNDFQSAGIEMRQSEGSITLQWSGLRSYQYRLLNVLGQVLAEGSIRGGSELELAHHFNGVGILHLSNDQGHWVKKIGRQ